MVPEQDREKASRTGEQAAHLQRPSATTSRGLRAPCGPLSSRRRGSDHSSPALLGLDPRLRQGTEVAMLQGLKQRAHVPGQRPAAAGPPPSLPVRRKASSCQQLGRRGWCFLPLGVLDPGEGPRPLLALSLGWQGQEPLGRLSHLGHSALAHAVPRLEQPPGSAWCTEPAPTQGDAQRAGAEPRGTPGVWEARPWPRLLCGACPFRVTSPPACQPPAFFSGVGLPQPAPSRSGSPPRLRVWFP